MVASLVRKAAAIWSVVRPHTARSVSAIWASRVSADAAGEDHARSSSSADSVAEKWSLAVAASSASFCCPARSRRSRSRALRRPWWPASLPGWAAAGRHAVPDRLDERFLHSLFGQPHVAEPRGQRGPDAPRLGPVEPLELGCVHLVRPGILRRGQLRRR